MADQCPRTVAVAGLSGARTRLAEDCLRRHGLFVESYVPMHGAINDLLKRGVLLIWIEAADGAERAEDEAELRHLALRGRERPGGVPNPYYAWRLAQVIVHDNGGSFVPLVTGLAEQLVSGTIAFLTYNSDLVLETSGVVGEERYQLLVLGAARAGSAA